MIENIGMEILEKACPVILKESGKQIRKTYQNLREKVANSFLTTTMRTTGSVTVSSKFSVSECENRYRLTTFM